MKHLIWAAAAALVLTPGSASATRSQQADASLARSGDLLISRDSMESLGAVTVALESGLSLTLEPGVRVTRSENGYLFATRTGKKIEIETESGRMVLPSPAMAQLSDGGWAFNGGKPLRTTALTARWATQDDTDSNLKSMQEAAKKLKTKADAPQTSKGNRKGRSRMLYGDNPMSGAEPFNTVAIQQLTHLSAIGF